MCPRPFGYLCARHDVRTDDLDFNMLSLEGLSTQILVNFWSLHVVPNEAMKHVLVLGLLSFACISGFSVNSSSSWQDFDCNAPRRALPHRSPDRRDCSVRSTGRSSVAAASIMRPAANSTRAHSAMLGAKRSCKSHTYTQRTLGEPQIQCFGGLLGSNRINLMAFNEVSKIHTTSYLESTIKREI